MKTCTTWPRAAFALSLAVAVTGCALTQEPAQSGLQPVTMGELRATSSYRSAEGSRPRTALVLGGGGLRGFAHIGVLRALEEAGIEPEIVVGTSAGAVVGAAYASGMNANDIARVARDVRIASLVDLTFSREGLMRGDSLAQWIAAFTRDKPIESFQRRFGAVATDLATAQPVLIQSGPAGLAIKASAAVPGMNVPVAYAGGQLVDGGVTSLLPVRFARAMGAERVIAVDIYCNEPPGEARSALFVVGRVMRTQSCLLAAPEAADADVLIRPTVRVPGMSDRASQERAIEVGFLAARSALRAHALTH